MDLNIQAGYVCEGISQCLLQIGDVNRWEQTVLREINIKDIPQWFIGLGKRHDDPYRYISDLWRIAVVPKPLDRIAMAAHGYRDGKRGLLKTIVEIFPIVVWGDDCLRTAPLVRSLEDLLVEWDCEEYAKEAAKMRRDQFEAAFDEVIVMNPLPDEALLWRIITANTTLDTNA